MTALEVFAVLVLAGAVIVLFYYYMREFNRTGTSGLDTLKTSINQAGKGITDVGNRVGEEISKKNFDSVKSNVTDMGRRVSDAGNRVSEGIPQKKSDNNVKEENKKSGFTEKVSGMGENLKGKVREVPINTDAFSARIDDILNDQSDQLIKDWELATKSDVGELEKKFSKVSRDIDNLEKRFNEYKEHSNKKFENIETRLKTLESEEEI